MTVMVEHAPWTGQILFTPHSDGTMASLTPLPAQNRHNTVTDPHHPCAKEAVSGNSRKSCLFSLRTVLSFRKNSAISIVFVIVPRSTKQSWQSDRVAFPLGKKGSDFDTSSAAGK